MDRHESRIEFEVPRCVVGMPASNPESCAGLLDGIRELCAAAQLKVQAALAVKVHAAIQQHACKDWEPEEPLRHAGDRSELLKALVEVLNVSLVSPGRHSLYSLVLPPHSPARKQKGVCVCLASYQAED